MIILHFHLQRQFIYELFHINFTSWAIVFRTSLLWPSGRKWRSFSARYCTDNGWTLSSLISLYIVKDHSQYRTEIPLLISYNSFWFSKLQKTKCLYMLPTLLPFKILQNGTKTFPSGQVNFEVWLSKLWILIGWQNMFLSCVWTGSCEQRYFLYCSFYL